TISTNRQELELRQRQLQSGTGSELNFIQDRFTQHFPESFALWKEMNPNDKSLQATPDPPNVDLVKRNYVESQLAMFLFENLENYLFRQGIDSIDWKSPEWAEY